MTNNSSQHDIHPPTSVLLELLEPLDGSVLVGFEPASGYLDLHVSGVPYDDRAGSAGLFGFVAPPTWTAIGAVLTGSTIQGAAEDPVTDDVSVHAVLTRTGSFGSTVVIDGVTLIDTREDTSDSNEDLVAEGVVVDAMHRVMGLPCPGSPPPLAMLVLSIWFEDLLRSALSRGSVSWSEAAAMHPGFAEIMSVNPSIETLAEGTVRSATRLDWERTRLRAGRRSGTTAELSAAEVRWMDATLFGRWVLASLPDAAMTARILEGIGSGEAASGIRTVTEAVKNRVLSVDDISSMGWSA